MKHPNLVFSLYGVEGNTSVNGVFTNKVYSCHRKSAHVDRYFEIGRLPYRYVMGAERSQHQQFLGEPKNPIMARTAPETKPKEGVI